jgi:uncharacterized membrane protein (DUF485 family)
MTRDEQVAALTRRRARVAGALTAVAIVIYFGFILLIAYAKPLLAVQIRPGLSVGILLGALVIASSWLLTLGYVRWANRHIDAALDALRE